MTTVVFNGLRVPWVTRWTGDASPQPFQLVSSADLPDLPPFVSYPDPRPGDWDNHGILWQREANSPTGEPEFSQVSTIRQRRCMLERRCQVCGDEIPEGPITWVMLRIQANVRDDGSVTTVSPPTCAPCIPIAMRLCPALRSQDYVTYQVEAYQPWGVMGESAWIKPDGSLGRERNTTVEYGGSGVFNVVAKQMVVQFTNFKELP